MWLTKSRKLVICTIFALNFFAVYGCQTNPLSSTNIIKNTDLDFQKVSSERKEELSRLITSTATTTGDSITSQPMPSAVPSAVPSAMATPSPLGSTLPDGQFGGGYAVPEPMPTTAPYALPASPGYYFGYYGSFDEYVIIDFEEAKSDGFTGTYLETMERLVKPLVSKLAADARLIYSSGNTNLQGENNNLDGKASPSPTPVSASESIVPMPYYSPYEKYQWNFTFASTAHKEVYNIFVSADETLVIRQIWGLKNLGEPEVKIDNSKAIALVVDAIKDKDFKMPEESYPSPYYYGYGHSETIYDVPADARTYVNLEKEKDTLIWRIEINYEQSDARPDNYISPAYATVNAETGEITTLTRAARHQYDYGVPSSSEPYISPTPTAIPTPQSTLSP